MNHSSKFSPKEHKGFLLGYGRVYNSHFGKVMETVNVRFEETNGSQKDHLPHDLGEPPLDEVIRSMAIGDIRLVKANARQNERNADIPLFPYIARCAGNQNLEDNVEQDEEEREPQNKENANPEGQANPEGNANPEAQDNPERNADPQGQAQPEGNVEPQGNEVALPRVQRRVDADMILESIAQQGHPTTRSRTSVETSHLSPC